MSPDPAKAKAIFLEAVEKYPPGQWEAFLDEACPGSPDLREEVGVLLTAHAEAAGFLEDAVDRGVDVLPADEKLGSMIGPYKLTEKLGEGGMGIVYVAKQEEPIQREVALKIIKPGMDTQEVLARFEAERQALAIMDHPSIAKVLDAGSTESGRPYFAMELVDGTPITTYCDANQITPGKRLELFVAVCQAVQHAHQKGIIHRDIKPTNVLVAVYDARAIPKIIDFGVSKAINQRLTEKTTFTRFGQVVGTAEYMSPEQASLDRLDVDTRSDVYSLGVLLYELLTGETPFDQEQLRTVAFDELLRIIREEEPPKPSSRLSTSLSLPSIAANRRIDPKKLGTLIRGDLDWVVMRALEKERGRRYDTASSLGADVQRFLIDEPVEASPPSAVYRFRKFTRRNRTALVTAVVVAVTLVLGAAVSGWQAIRATRAMRAQQQAMDVATEQRELAEQNATDAMAERRRAEDAAARLQRYLYAAHIRLAYQAWKNADIGWAVELLSRHLPGADGVDLRGFEWYYLQGLCQKDLRTLRGHEGDVYCVAFSPDGLTLATASEDATVRLWDVADGRLRKTINGHVSEVNHVTFSPDGATLATVSDGGGAMLWDVATGSPKGSLDGHTDDVFAVAFSPDGRWLATGGCDDTAKLWDAATLEEQVTLRGHTNDVESLVFSPDSKTLATVGSDCTVKLWDVPSGKEHASWRAHDDWVSCVAYSHDGSKLVTASKDLTIKVWNATAGQLLWSAAAHRDRIHCVAFSPDDGKVVSTSKDGMVRLWDADSGEPEGVIRGHMDRVWWGAFSPDGRLLATAGADGTARLWDVDVPQEYVRATDGRSGVHAIGFARGSEVLAYLTFKKELRLRDLKTGREDSFAGAPDAWTCFLAVSADGRIVATGGEYGFLRVFDAAATRELPSRIDPHPGGISAMAFASGDHALATVGRDGSVRLWDVDAGCQRAAWQTDTDDFLSLAIAPNGGTLATGHSDGTLELWNVETGQRRATLASHGGPVHAVAFAPDGKLMASAGDDRTVRLWDPGTGSEIATLVGHAACVRDLAFSPDGRTLASASEDRTVRLWSVFSGQELLRLDGHTLPIHRVAFSQDGRLLASLGQAFEGGCEVFLWSANAKSGIGE